MHSGLMFFGTGVEAVVQVVGTVTASTATTTDMTLDLSAIDIQSGDLILVAAASGGSSSVYLPMVSSGFTSLLEVGTASTYDTGLATYYKVATGAETEVVVDSGSDTNAGKVVILYVLREVSDIDSQSGSTSSSVIPPQVAITSSSKLFAICFFAGGSNLGSLEYTNSSLEGFQSVSANANIYDMTLASGYSSFVGSFTPDACGISGSDSASYTAVAATLAL